MGPASNGRKPAIQEQKIAAKHLNDLPACVSALTLRNGS